MKIVFNNIESNICLSFDFYITGFVYLYANYPLRYF